MACKYCSIVCTLHCMPHACRTRALCTPHAPYATRTLCTPHARSARFKLIKPIAQVTIIERCRLLTRQQVDLLRHETRLRTFSEPIQPIQNFYCRSLELLNNSLKIPQFFCLYRSQSLPSVLLHLLLFSLSDRLF